MSSILKSIIVNNLNLKQIKMSIIVRQDIKLSKGKTAAQCSHASILCYEKCLKLNPIILKQWIKMGQPKVILRISDLNELEELYEKVKKTNVIAELVKDAGRTEIAPGTITVLGLGPDYEQKIDDLVRHLKLL